MTDNNTETLAEVRLTDAEKEALRQRVCRNWPFEVDADTGDEVRDIADGVAVEVERILAARIASSQASGPGWFWTQTEWAEWSNDLARLIPEGDVGRYSNYDGAQESIIEDCLRAYVAERAGEGALRERIEALIDESESNAGDHCVRTHELRAALDAAGDQS